MITFKKFFESIEPMGLIETITFKELGPVEAKIDSGNGAYNVLHGVNVKVLPDGRVSFNTVNDQILDLPIEEFIDINIGDGVIKKRPVVSFDIAVGDDYYPNTKFSIGDRTENEYKILVGKEFIEQLGGLIDVTKQNNLD